MRRERLAKEWTASRDDLNSAVTYRHPEAGPKRARMLAMRNVNETRVKASEDAAVEKCHRHDLPEKVATVSLQGIFRFQEEIKLYSFRFSISKSTCELLVDERT